MITTTISRRSRWPRRSQSIRRLPEAVGHGRLGRLRQGTFCWARARTAIFVALHACPNAGNQHRSFVRRSWPTHSHRPAIVQSLLLSSTIHGTGRCSHDLPGRHQASNCHRARCGRLLSLPPLRASQVCRRRPTLGVAAASTAGIRKPSQKGTLRRDAPSQLIKSQNAQSIEQMPKRIGSCLLSIQAAISGNEVQASLMLRFRAHADLACVVVILQSNDRTAESRHTAMNAWPRSPCPRLPERRLGVSHCSTRLQRAVANARAPQPWRLAGRRSDRLQPCRSGRKGD